MENRPELERVSERNEQPIEMDRRSVLRQGAKLAYIVPVVLAALKATPASAAPAVSGGTPPK